MQNQKCIPPILHRRETSGVHLASYIIRLAEAINFALVSNDLLFPSWDRLMYQKSSKCSKVALPCFLARCHPMRGCQTPQIGIRLPLFLVS